MKPPPDQPTIIDTREQTHLPISNLSTETGTLYSGDYSVKGLEEVCDHIANGLSKASFSFEPPLQ